MPQVARGVGKDFLIPCAENVCIPGRDPAIPLFPEVAVRWYGLADLRQGHLDIPQLYRAPISPGLHEQAVPDRFQQRCVQAAPDQGD